MSSLSSIGEEYVYLVHQLDNVLKQTLGKDTIVVDSYFGPPLPDLSTQTIEPDELIHAFITLQNRIRTDLQIAPQRTYLIKQLNAMMLLIRYALEENVTFEERVRIGLDIVPVTIKSERIEELQEETNRILRRKVRKADLATMVIRWRKKSLITGNEIMQLAQETAASARQSTQRVLFSLPDSEIIEFREVNDAPWGAYHHYHGNYRALIEINTKLPRSKYSLWSWITHETYPGHQTHLVVRELGYTRGELGVHGTVTVINTPECTIAEGLAESGTVLLSDDRPLSEAEQITAQIGQLQRTVGINVIMMLNYDERSEIEALNYLKDMGAYDEEYAKARLPFMTDPMWAPYGFTYFIGAWLVGGFFHAAQEANLLNEFIQTLYHELHIPSTLKARIQELGLKLPSLAG